MDSLYLKTLIAVIETSSFSRAAERLSITQSAVSQRIKFIENHYGYQLINRSGPALALTPAGQMVMNSALEILRKEQELVDCLKSSRRSNPLYMCCTPSFSLIFLTQVLDIFRRLHPNMTDFKYVLMQPAEAMQAMRKKEIDLAVLEHCPGLDFSGLDQHVLPDDELAFVAAPNNSPLDLEGLIHFDELCNSRLYTCRNGWNCTEVLLEELQALGLEMSSFKRVINSDDLFLTIQAVLSGKGIAFLSKALVSSYLESGEMVSFTLSGVPKRRNRSVFLHNGRQQNRLLHDLLEVIHQVLVPGERPQLTAEANQETVMESDEISPPRASDT